MTLAKARQNLGEEEFGIIVGYAEPDAAAQSLARQRGERARLDLHHAPGEIDQLLALFREAGAAPLFDEKRAAELLFEPAHMHRHRRLRLVHAFGGAGEGAGVDNGEEGAELVGVEHMIDPESRWITLQTFVGPINRKGPYWAHQRDEPRSAAPLGGERDRFARRRVR